ncbi:MAG: NAD regulator [Alphaproteobacteria bacterium]|nr:NAD regulator [Alphaproteobacteria bacterium]
MSKRPIRTTGKTTHAGAAPVAVALNAVILVVDEDAPKVLCARSADGAIGLPYGPFDPARHRTFETGLREWVERQTSVRLGFVEQLYTFGDKGREAPAALIEGGDASARVVSVGYLALAAEAAPVNAADAQWRSWYDFFPWEDWRRGAPQVLEAVIEPGFTAWFRRATDAATRAQREARVAAAFGMGDLPWEEERALDRYEAMYEAGLVAESWRDRTAAGLAPPGGDPDLPRATGLSMGSDHRRILATAIGRVRGKLKYRPIVFDLMPSRFTLLSLQRAVEAIVGFNLHKQNFRRHVEGAGLVEKTELTERQTSGRPAALFKAAAMPDKAAGGLSIPRVRTAVR